MSLKTVLLNKYFFYIELTTLFHTITWNILNLRGRHMFIPATTAQRPMTSDFKGFSIPDFIHYIYFPILILEKEPVFPFLMFSAKQGYYWYHFYNVFGMTRSLTGD